MIRFVLTTAAALATAGLAAAQPFQGQQYQGGAYQYPYTQSTLGPYYQTPSATVMPNIYNPVNQPLSPYLNMLRGGNPGVNYYYGVRPGTAGGTGFGIGAPFTAAGGNRALFFPQLMNAPDPLEALTESGTAPPPALPPAGHPSVFNNTLGYFPSPYGGRGGMRPGLAGVGNRPPAGRR
jgi:hypothetical protein